ncbi:MAG: diguanylate cyclase [Pseudobacteriovorax sp.]|nr:diguanylate cyclase [Pseudobacteriovorax sp.]
MAVEKLGKCLIIGNSAVNLLAYTEQLSKTFVVETASTYDSSIDLLDDFEPAVVVIDERIAGSSAIEISDTIRNDQVAENYIAIVIIADHQCKSLDQLRELSRSDYVLHTDQAALLLAQTCIGAFRLKRLEDSNRQQRQELSVIKEELSHQQNVDPISELRALPNMLNILSEEFRRCVRFDIPLTLLMVAIDNFEDVVARGGYLSSTTIAKQLGKELSEMLRNEDFIGRGWNCDFICILPETGDSGALILAKRIQESVFHRTYGQKEHQIQVSVSQGIGYFHPLKNRFDSPEALFLSAQDNLSIAKKLGTNQISHKKKKIG